MRTYAPCPRCAKSKWAEREDRANWRRRVLHCMECGFEVDMHVAARAKGILRRDRGQDVAQPAQVSDGPSD